MKIIADTHVHFYPCYQLGLALSTLINKLDTLVPDAIKAAFLVERSDCRFYAQLEENGYKIVQNGYDFSLKKEKGKNQMRCFIDFERVILKVKSWASNSLIRL